MLLGENRMVYGYIVGYLFAWDRREKGTNGCLFSHHCDFKNCKDAQEINKSAYL